MFQRLEWKLSQSFVGEIIIKIRINFEYTKYVTYSTQVWYGEKSDFIPKMALHWDFIKSDILRNVE